MADWPKCAIHGCEAEADFKVVYRGNWSQWTGVICRTHADKKKLTMKPWYVNEAYMRVVSIEALNAALQSPTHNKDVK